MSTQKIQYCTSTSYVAVYMGLTSRWTKVRRDSRSATCSAVGFHKRCKKDDDDEEEHRRGYSALAATAAAGRLRNSNNVPSILLLLWLLCIIWSYAVCAPASSFFVLRENEVVRMRLIADIICSHRVRPNLNFDRPSVTPRLCLLSIRSRVASFTYLVYGTYRYCTVYYGYIPVRRIFLHTVQTVHSAGQYCSVRCNCASLTWSHNDHDREAKRQQKMAYGCRTGVPAHGLLSLHRLWQRTTATTTSKKDVGSNE